MSATRHPLNIVQEGPALEAVELSRLHVPVAPPGVRALIQDVPPEDAEAAAVRLRSRGAGLARPERQDPWRLYPTEVCRVADVVHSPRFGALVRDDGTAYSASLDGSLADLSHLAAAPGMAMSASGLTFAPPPDLAVIPAGGVFLPWGAGFNYGHFVLDALPSLLALDEAGLTTELQPIAPPLKPWQRELIALLLGREGGVREIAAPAVRLEQAAYATSMDHFLHAPNALLSRVRARLTMRAGGSPLRAERIYLSRRSHAHPMRILLNELELEQALAARGFAIVRAERWRPAQQVALARQARVVVGATGAGMANALFAEPGALVIDIQPQVFPSAWVGAFSELIGHDWWTYYVPAPATAAETPWLRRVRRGFRFAYRLPLAHFLAFLDERL